VCFSFFSRSSDGWGLQTGHIIKQFKAHEGAVTALVTANDVFLSAGTDGVVNVWSKVCSPLRRRRQLATARTVELTLR
jgi:hypothetical protein